MRRYDMVSTLFFLALAGYVIQAGFRLGFGTWHEPGPGFIAVLAGALLAGLSAVWLTMTLAASSDRGRRFFKERDSLKKVLLALGALVGFALLLDRAGFLLSCLLLLLFLFRAIEPQRWPLTIALTVGVTLLCALVFQVWLQVQFPEGPISTYALLRSLF